MTYFNHLVVDKHLTILYAQTLLQKEKSKMLAFWQPRKARQSRLRKWLCSLAQPCTLSSLDFSHPTNLSQAEFLLSGRLTPFFSMRKWSICHVSALHLLVRHSRWSEKKSTVCVGLLCLLE